MSLSDIDGEMELKAKIRYSHSGSMCKVTRTCLLYTSNYTESEVLDVRASNGKQFMALEIDMTNPTEEGITLDNLTSVSYTHLARSSRSMQI